MPSQGTHEGGKFSSSINNHLGMDGKPTWDSAATTRYSYGTGLALAELLNSADGTYGFSWNSLPVDNEASVTLANFETVASAFDRVAQFFSDQQKIVEEWQSRLGTEKDKAWRGKAAGVFWDLINKINKQYSDYADDMKATGDSKSKQGAELRQAKRDFKEAVEDLHEVWNTWQWRYGNPLAVLHTLLSAIVEYVWKNNITKITYEVETYGTYGGGYGTYTNYIAEDEFSNEAAIDAIEGEGKMPLSVEAQSFGELKELDTWVKIGNKALLMWRQTVEDNLDKAAISAMTKVRDSWSNSELDFGSVKSRGTSSTLESDYKEEKAELAEEKAAADAAAAKAAAEEAARKQEAFIQWQKEQAAKAEAERKKEKEEAERKEREAKAEAERKEKEAKAEAERKEREAKAEAERKEKEAEAKAAPRRPRPRRSRRPRRRREAKAAARPRRRPRRRRPRPSRRRRRRRPSRSRPNRRPSRRSCGPSRRPSRSRSARSRRPSRPRPSPVRRTCRSCR